MVNSILPVLLLTVVLWISSCGDDPTVDSGSPLVDTGKANQSDQNGINKCVKKKAKKRDKKREKYRSVWGGLRPHSQKKNYSEKMPTEDVTKDPCAEAGAK